MANYTVTGSRKVAGIYEHSRIVGVCAGGNFYDKATVYDSLKAGNTWTVHRAGYPDVQVEAKLDGGIKYIQTRPDQYKQNNLLNLEDCYGTSLFQFGASLTSVPRRGDRLNPGIAVHALNRFRYSPVQRAFDCFMKASA